MSRRTTPRNSGTDHEFDQFCSGRGIGEEERKTKRGRKSRASSYTKK